MSRKLRHIKSQSNATYEEPYAISDHTTATFISTEIMERNAEKESVRQENQVVHDESKLAKD